MAETQNLFMEMYYLQGSILEVKNEIKELKQIASAANSYTEALKSEIMSMKSTCQTNCEHIKNALVEQKIWIKKLTEKFNSSKFAALFPIKTQKELEDIESKINDENHEEMVETVFQLIRNGGFKNNVRSLFAINVIMDHNLDGKQGKIPLISYKRLMNVFVQSAQKAGACEKDCLRDLRRALKAEKNRQHKLAWLKKKTPEVESEYTYIQL